MKVAVHYSHRLSSQGGDARKAMESIGIEAWLIDAILEEFYNTRVGNRTTTNTVEEIIGRKPTFFAQSVRDYANSFN